MRMLVTNNYSDIQLYDDELVWDSKWEPRDKVYYVLVLRRKELPAPPDSTRLEIDKKV